MSIKGGFVDVGQRAEFLDGDLFQRFLGAQFPEGIADRPFRFFNSDIHKIIPFLKI
jgi:hypothetical protein